MLEFLGWIMVGVLIYWNVFLVFKLINCIVDIIKERREEKNDLNSEIEVEWFEECDDGSMIVGTSGMVVYIDTNDKIKQ